MTQYFNLRKQLVNAVSNDDDLVFLSYSIVDDLSKIHLTENQRSAVIAEILYAFQEFPDADWGLPGPLVHWLEEPANRDISGALSEAFFLDNPAPHIAFMVNRGANTAKSSVQKEKYRKMFREALTIAGVSESAIELINYQLTRLDRA